MFSITLVGWYSHINEEDETFNTAGRAAAKCSGHDDVHDIADLQVEVIAQLPAAQRRKCKWAEIGTESLFGLGGFAKGYGIVSLFSDHSRTWTPARRTMVQFTFAPPLFGKIFNITGKNLGDFFSFVKRLVLMVGTYCQKEIYIASNLSEMENLEWLRLAVKLIIHTNQSKSDATVSGTRLCFFGLNSLTVLPSPSSQDPTCKPPSTCACNVPINGSC